MHEDLQSIVAADLAARRDLDDLTARLAARLEAERVRLEGTRAAAAAGAAARLDAEVAGVDAAARAVVAARRAARDARRASRRSLADGAADAAVAAYLEIVRRASGRGDRS
jgi:hypothetical protein